MNKINHVSAFVFSVLATVLIGGATSASTISDTQDATTEITTTQNEVTCITPLNRDYHDVLAAFNADTSDDYKFSGCGGVL